MSAFLFHRSLRLNDNLGLIEALQEDSVIPIFCVDPRQAIPENNPYFSPFCLGFMYEALQDLKKQLEEEKSDLLLLKGEPHKVLPPIFKKKNIKKLFMNKDYTPFALKRTQEIQKAIPTLEIIEVQDYLLFDFGSILTGSNTAYRVYTSFLNSSKRKKIPSPQKIKNTKNLLSKSALNPLQNKSAWDILKKHSKLSPFYTPGGREEALKRLKSLPQTQTNYSKCRNFLTYKTSRLSAYIKFGCISIREAWEGFGKVPGEAGKGLQRELMWREFYYHYYIAYPEELEWDKKSKEAKLDKDAPDIVKACFKELDTVGYLHNRGRMILGNYILKYQKDYWKEGDKMYARRLVDYDPFVNIGNWRWIEKQPSFRTLKPKTQEKWDRGCFDKKESYTKFWLKKD